VATAGHLREIEIDTNNVTIDLNGFFAPWRSWHLFRLSTFPAPPASNIHDHQWHHLQGWAGFCHYQLRQKENLVLDHVTVFRELYRGEFSVAASVVRDCVISGQQSKTA